jgi:F-type H+-transporting ATPase subunit delta
MAVFTLRYAKALEQVVEDKRLDAAAVLQQLKDFAGTFAASAQLREVLTDPSMSKEQKLRILDAIAGKIGMLPQVRNLIAVIADHERLSDLDGIIVEYAALADAHAGWTDAEITSAHALNAADRAELEAQASKLAGGRIRASYREDRALLGGAIVKIGSTIYDGSVRGQLQQLKQKLVSA